MNAITAFVDGSNVYSSNEEDSIKLRTMADGLMKTHETIKDILPTRKQCRFSTKLPQNASELVAGDVRAIIQPTLASTHTLFLGEHNRVAKELKKEFIRTASLPTSPLEADEFIYQETRKIIGAELQKIVYKDYLPIILGSSAMANNGLDFANETDYDPGVDPSILNEFATVAYRFGHSTISDRFK